MEEQLQHLLDKLKKDGVDKARAESDKIISDAESRKEGILNEARKKAGTIVAEAEKKAESLVENGRISLQQAARDTVLSVGKAITRLFEEIARKEVKTALDEGELSDTITAVIRSYAERAGEEPSIELLLGPEQKEKLGDRFAALLRNELKSGITVKADASVAAGFRVRLVDRKVEHDFSSDAIAEALCGLLRPRMAEIVAAGMKAEGGGRNGEAAE